MIDTFHRLAEKAPDEKLQQASSIKIHAEIIESHIVTAIKHGDGDKACMEQALFRLHEAMMWATKGLTA